MMKIRQNLVPESIINKVSYGKGNTKKRICIHETDNTRLGADADAHSRLQKNGNSRQASWHWQVDDKEAVQSFLHDICCWAAGNGNNEAIHIEICVNYDGDYQKAVANAATLVAKIMQEEGILLSNVVQHNYYTNKNCPNIMRAGKVVNWAQFIEMVKVASGTLKQSNPAVDNSKYRIFTGTYNTIQAAQNVLDVLKHRFGWIAYIVPDGKLWRVKTGTFTGLHAVETGISKIKAAKLASIVYKELA
ncbi:peptidoglycan recognition protein family protein [Lysinibacillus piscis]|uniref:N-acetylmuramoyl-L-alanine amidase n=1 Tax=Lysinibacillus piscis TaxID=2518931 RepID=A0ABQ5NGH6_9BACI|nr:N-acetylmuramoyl-L-alanine amidase [Lysinibacillus sp. KH24]GLC87476.1 hypothetical protein LYSBPC_06030 [Lysinibacillus sp. KH24]